ncbi:HPP-domain-containing protein [Nemania sp. FL0916]|nr:HPP-domain-containing protein [Nemania sp. FL0916]
MSDEDVRSSPWHQRLPSWITRWVGIRNGPAPPKPVYVPYLWAFIGAFGGLSLLQAIFDHSPEFIARGVPPIIASYGATAVLCYAVPEAPLAQPRSVLGGHFFSALTGIIITKIFQLNNLSDEESPRRLAWLAATLASSIAILVMQVTKTIHPPAGATALLPIVTPAVNRLSWYLLPVVLLSSVLMITVALITNNIQQRYPTFWWAPNPPPAKPVLPVTNDKESK